MICPDDTPDARERRYRATFPTHERSYLSTGSLTVPTTGYRGPSHHWFGMTDASGPEEPGGLPRYLKVIIAVAALVILFVLVIDLLTFASAL